jgi:putative flippase GtrA
MILQLATLHILNQIFGWHYLIATAVAVEAAILHNFIWHDHWTWRDRPVTSRQRVARLMTFNTTNGFVSVAGNVVLTALFAGWLGVPIIIANIMAVALCSAANFLAADRVVFRPASALAIVVMLLPATASAAELTPETLAAWETYVQATEARIARELDEPKRFLALDFPQGEEDARAARRLVGTRNTLMVERETRTSSGARIPVPDGRIHHWLGAIFVPGVTVDRVAEWLQHPDQHKQTDVITARVLERTPDGLKVFMKLTRSKIVTVSYNTEHLVRIRRHGTGRLSSSSVSLRIAELADAGTPQEREKPLGDDHGFLWRLNSYWRYMAVDGGVIVECESLSLSRDVPVLLSPVASPIVASIARESLNRTLESVRAGLK